MAEPLLIVQAIDRRRCFGARAQAGRGASGGTVQPSTSGHDLDRDAERDLEERVASAPAGALASTLRSSESSGGQPPLGAICMGMHDDIKLNAFAKFRCALWPVVPSAALARSLHGARMDAQPKPAARVLQAGGVQRQPRRHWLSIR